MNDSRAEQAFRDAFRQQADRLEPTPLRVVRRRRRWPVIAAAAAVLVLVGVVGLVAALPDDPGPRPEADDPVATGALPVATHGWRWVTWRDVGVEVPESWVDGDEPGGDWCAETGQPDKPAGPYAARSHGGLTLDILCTEETPPAAFGPAPIRLMVPHLTFATPGEVPDGESTYRGWTATLRTVGSVQLRLYTDSATVEVGDHVLGSIRTFTTDANGCDTSSPVQAEQPVRPEPFDVATVADVDSISICQYDRYVDLGAVALAASRRIEGADADALLAAVQEAPTGGGPDRPEQCTDDVHGDQALAVRLHHDGAIDDLYVYYDWCSDNGYDDGTTRRELTAGNCRPLFGGTVVAWSYSSFLRGRCGSQ